MKKYIFLLLFILIAGCFVRFYKFSAPIADWHSWRQADTSSVSRIFTQDGFDLLHPRFHDLSNVPSGLDNLQGYRFVEFPIYNTLQAGAFVLFNSFSLEEWGRIVTILGSLASTVFLYAIVSRHSNKLAGIGSAFFFAFLPFNIFYGRVILPDPLTVTATLGSIYFFDLWIDLITRHNQGSTGKAIKSLILFSLSIIFGMSALLLKPFAAFFLLPIIVLAYSSFGLGMLKKWKLYLFVVLVVAPLVLWRWWIVAYPEGVPVSDWLFNGGDIRFKGAYFYWIFADRIGRLILGYFGVAILILGLLAVSSKKYLAERKDQLFFFSFLFSSLLYLVVIARGNVQHDYYQVPIIPTLAIFLGFGTLFLLKPLEGLSKRACYSLFVLLTLATLTFGWYHVRDFFNINNPSIVVAGEAVDRLTPKDARVITFYNGDTSFLYQTKRKGWASLQSPLPKMIELGANHLVIVDPTDADRNGFGQEYEIVSSDPRYLILKLSR